MREFNVIPVEWERKEGLGHRGVATAGNSGYQAVNLAYLLGASRIVLLGFDMQPKAGRNHWHPDHRGGTLTNPTADLYRKWIAAFTDLHRLLADEGVELVNASRDTALTIPRMAL